MSMYRPFASRRGSSKASQKQSVHSRDAIQNAAWYAVEKLENRRLFAQGSLLTGGGVIDGVPQERTYTYLDAENQTDKIALWGSITAEFLFVRVNEATNTPTVTSAIPIPPTGTTATGGADLFAIYVSSASPTASISIAQEATGTTTGAVSGFTTAMYSLTVNSAQPSTDPIIISPTAESGGIYIGARSFLKTSATDTAPAVAGVPLLSVPLSNQVGVRPVTADNTLYAGIVTAPGVSLNRILIGGMVTGRVDIGGSINTFYAGDIYTGNTEGISAGSQPTGALARNFNVAGDLGNLLSLGSIGTTTVTTTGKPAYETGFRLSVGGHIAEVKSYDSFDGSVYAQNLSTLRGLGTSQQEIETDGPTPMASSGETFFEGNATNSDGEPTGPALNEDPAINNNGNFANAQFLGTPFSSTQGHNAIQLQGSLDNGTGVGDDVDIYAVALGAEQTITATLVTGSTDLGDLDLGIFSPQAATGSLEIGTGSTTLSTSSTALLASTYNLKNSLALVNQPLTFTSTDAGIYYFAVGYEGDSSFTGDDAAPVGLASYELDVTGVKNIGIGAVAAVNNIEFTSGAQPSVRVDTGDLGAIVTTGTGIGSTGGVILAGDSLGDGFFAASPITATTGSIRVIQAGSIGAQTGTLTAFAPDIRAAGNVGVIRTLNTEADGGVMAVNTDILAVGEGVAIGGSYQLVDCAGLFAASLVADGSIGTIRAEDVGLMNFAPVLQVNADSSKTPGSIDLIDVTGDPVATPINSGHFGTLDAGGPKIATGPGGNVRYIHIAPAVTIFNDSFFGGDTDEPIAYAAGKTVALIDDSGTPFTVVPYRGATVSGDSTQPVATGSSTSTTTSGDTSTIAGDTLTVETYGIEDKGGVAVISLTATAGDITVATSTGTSTGTSTTATGPTSISVDTSAAGAKSSVEFGEINMVGGGTDLTFDPLTQTFTSSAGTGNDVAEDNSATFNGKSPIDIFDYDATSTALTAGGIAPLVGATNIINNTSGEIVNFAAQDVGTLEAASLGFAKSHTDSPVGGATIQLDQFPFHGQRNMIQIGGTLIDAATATDPTLGTAGAAQTIESTGPLGNILTNGTIGNVFANTDKKATRGQVDGIIAPIYAASPLEYTPSRPDYSTLSGNILNVNIGQGLGYSGSGDFAVTGIFADNYIGSVVNQGIGSDIRGTIASGGLAGGLTAPVLTSPISGLPEPTKAGGGLFINNITLSNGGSIIDANIMTPSSLAMTLQTNTTGFTITEPNTTTSGDSADAEFGVGTISLTGNGGIIGSVFITGGVNAISVKGGFGIINSDIENLNADVVGSIRADGYGIRSCVITGQNSVNSIDATGDGEELKSTSYSASVLQSEGGLATDFYSGLPLNGSNDLDDFLGTTHKKPTRKGATEAGVIADTTITGTFNLGSITAWRIVGNIAAPATTLKQQLAEEIADTPAMTISFANSIGKISVAENTTNLSVTTGSLNTFESGDNVIGTKFNVAGEIKTLTAGFLSGSTQINATGPDGIINYLSTTSGLNATVNASVSIGEILVGTDLGSTNVDSGGAIDELYVKGSVLKGANVIAGRAINILTIRHNLLGGSTIQARSIGTKTIGGVNNGNIIIVPPSP